MDAGQLNPPPERARDNTTDVAGRNRARGPPHSGIGFSSRTLGTVSRLVARAQARVSGIRSVRLPGARPAHPSERLGEGTRTAARFRPIEKMAIAAEVIKDIDDGSGTADAA